MAFKFENLKICQLSLELTDEVESLAKSFPQHELYSLSSQIRKAANSVSLNIVEGAAGYQIKNLRDFLSLQTVQLLKW